MIKNRSNVSRILVIFLLSSMLILQGCSVFMAARQPDYKDLNVLSKGVPRSKVVAELGAPILTEEKEGKKVDVFAFKQGYGKGNKTARACFHAAADIWTLGLWEIIGTPAELIASGKKMQVEVAYNANDEVEQINYIDKKVVPKKQKEPAPKKSVQEALNKNEQVIEKKEEVVLIKSYAEYYRWIYQDISKNVVRPQGVESGSVNASFVLLPDGSLKDVTILDSSSENIVLRKAVDNAIKESAPFPPFPQDMKAKDKETFNISLDFKRQ